MEEGGEAAAGSASYFCDDGTSPSSQRSDVQRRPSPGRLSCISSCFSLSLSLSLAFVASFVRSTARCYDIFAPPTNKGRAGKEKKNRPRPVLLLSICPICRVCCVCCLFFRPVASVHLSEPPAVSSYTQPASHLRFYALQVCLFRAWACFFLL